MVIGFWDTIVPKLFGALTPDMVMKWVQPSLQPAGAMQQASMWLALVLGVMMLWRLAPRGGWIAAWPLAFIVGVTAGLKIVSHVESDLMAQSVATMQPVVQLVPAAGGGTDWYASLWPTLANALVLVGVICALVYFLFSVQHKGVVGATARVGVWYLMITFGASFGFTVMGRIALPDLPSMQADGQAWADREAALADSHEAIEYQGAYVQSLVDLTDYPDFDIKGMNEAFFAWKQHKVENIMGFRDNSYKSLITGTMAPPHHTPWKDALDDSMQAYLR
jgi:hypothetical protein